MALFLFTKAILENQPIQIFNYGDMMRDFTYVDDIVTGMTELLTKSRAQGGSPPHYVYNIGNHTPVKLMEFIECIEETLGKKAIRELLPMQPGDVPSTCADVKELMQDTGFGPDTPLRKGVRCFIDWYQSYYNA